MAVVFMTCGENCPVCFSGWSLPGSGQHEVPRSALHAGVAVQQGGEKPESAIEKRSKNSSG